MSACSAQKGKASATCSPTRPVAPLVPVVFGFAHKCTCFHQFMCACSINACALASINLCALASIAYCALASANGSALAAINACALGPPEVTCWGHLPASDPTILVDVGGYARRESPHKEWPHSVHSPPGESAARATWCPQANAFRETFEIWTDYQAVGVAAVASLVLFGRSSNIRTFAVYNPTPTSPCDRYVCSRILG
jgi:hypothetical protein